MAKNMNQNYFTNLMVLAIGDRTKKDFAAAIGISPEYLSRLMNPNNKIIPSKDLLKKVAEVSESPFVSREELFKSCGYSIDPHRTSLRYIANQMVNSVMEWSKSMNSISGPLVFGIDDTADRDVEKAVIMCLDFYFKTLAFCDLDFTFKLVPIEQDVCDRNDCEAAFGITMTHTIKEGFAHVDVYFVLAGHYSKQNKFYIDKICTSGVAVMGFGIIPDEVIDYYNKKNYDIDNIDVVFYISEDPDKKKTYNKMVDKMMEKIFGKDLPRLVSLIEGNGFYLDEVPVNFIDFALKHFDSWMPIGESYDFVRDTLLTLKNSDDSFDVKANIIEDFFKDAYPVHNKKNGSTCPGWQAIIANVMTTETKYDFEYWPAERNPMDIYDFDNRDTVLCPMETLMENYKDLDPVIQDLKHTLVKYALELGISTVEYCYYELEFYINENDREMIDVNDYAKNHGMKN